MVGVKAAIYGLAGFLGLLETFWGSFIVCEGMTISSTKCVSYSIFQHNILSHPQKYEEPLGRPLSKAAPPMPSIQS